MSTLLSRLQLLLVILTLLKITAPLCSAASSNQASECSVDGDCDFADSSDGGTSRSSAGTSDHNFHSWFEDASKEGLKFLQQNVFGQAPKTSNENAEERQESFSHLSRFSQEEEEEEDDKETKQENDGILATLSSILSAEHPDEALFQVLLSRGSALTEEEDNPSLKDTAQLFMDHASEVLEQLQRTFDDRLGRLVKDHFFIPSAWYLLRKEQETKHAYWKQLKHRFFDKVTDTRTFKELHQALYLSDLAYVDSEPEVREGLSKVENGTWELLFVDTKGNPSEPAHFLAVQKQTAPLKPPSLWEMATGRHLEEKDTLKVLLVVRGTKTLADALSDGLLEAVEYKGFKAHGGIQRSGKYIVEKHIKRLKQLLEASGRSRIELYLFGHSLGAGTASIAAMEFHDQYSDFISVQAVGFGCPSLVSPELSERYKDIITTVITDADVVPRMSGASLVNLHLEMLSLDWTDYLMEELQGFGGDILKDVTAWTNGAGTTFVQDILDRIRDRLEKHFQNEVKPSIQKAIQAIPQVIPTNRLTRELVPPGSCLHLFRSATGFESAYTPCNFFDEIEYVPHLIQDHMTGSGYHFALLSLLRHQLQDFNAVFENELVTLKK